MSNCKNQLSSPVRIANARIGKIVAVIPEAAEPATDANYSTGIAFGIGYRLALLFCVLLVAGGIVNFCYQAKLFQHPVKLFDINRVNIKPGLYIRCKSCGTAIYNVKNPYDACWTVCTKNNNCLYCLNPDNLEVMVSCPQCKHTYEPQLLIYETIIRKPYPLVRYDCTLNAVCPDCGKVLYQQEKVVITDE